MTRQLHLNAFLMSTGHHEASWRLPESDPTPTPTSRTSSDLARIAERGKLDSLFFADSPGAVGRRRPAAGRHARADRAADRDRRGDRARSG